MGRGRTRKDRKIQYGIRIIYKNKKRINIKRVYVISEPNPNLYVQWISGNEKTLTVGRRSVWRAEKREKVREKKRASLGFENAREE